MDVTIDISNVTIETERLILRAWKQTDLQDFYEYASEPGVGEMAGWPHHESIEVSRRILDSFIEEKCCFAITLKDGGKAIGSLGLHPSWANAEPKYADLTQKEVGYVLSKAYWGAGLMPEAVKAVIKYCFDELNLDALSVCHFSYNPQSRRVIEKCGFEFIRTGDYYSRHMDKHIPDLKYILLNPAK